MKRILKSWALVAAAAMGAVACQKEMQEEVPVTGETVQVTFVAGAADTKTSVDTSDDETPLFSWDESETFAVLEQRNSSTPTKAGSVEYEKVDGKAKITATFGAGSYVKGATIYQYVTIYPATGYVGAESLAAATLSLPAEQTMATGSYDPAADLMVSTISKTTAPPTEAQMVSFTRMAAVVKMTLKNFTLEAGDQVEQVIFTAEGKTLAGTITANLAKPNGFAAAEGVDNVTVNTTSSTDVYFTVLPTTLKEGDAYTVTILTNKKLYIKQGTIPEEKTLDFKKGMVTRLGVNMKDVAPSDKWILVRDASTLKEGDVVTIAAKNSNYVLGADMANSYPYASETEVVKIGDYLYHPDGDQADNMVQKFTLVKRDAARNAFDFYNGNNDYEGDEDSGFLWAPDSGSKYLKLQGYYSSNTQFDVTIDDSGEATVIATNGTGSSKQIMYNSSTYASSRYFHCYSEITDAKKICIYRQEGAMGTIPEVAPNVSVPDSDESVTIAEEGTQSATVIEDVVFNYVGDWTISVTSSESWLSVSYADGKLSYTAEANIGAARKTEVTIIASKEGRDDIYWKFNVAQKGGPTEVTITEFKTKEKDLTVTYKLTGKIATVPSSTSGAWVLEDENGNQAKISYLKTESGSYVKGNVDINVGDVMTVTTVVTGTTKGSGGNSSYPSIYKGHYTLAATASGSVGYEGGSATVNVKVEKFGHVVNPPTSISVSEVKLGAEAHDDYSFTDNGDGTATAVVNLDENTGGGSREVTLSFTAGSPLVITASVVVKQDVNPALKTGWWLVTDVNELKTGDKIIIAATGLDYAISTETYTNNRKSKPITKDGGALKNVADNIQQYELEIDANGLYSFKGTIGTDANKYIYAASSSNNYMKVSTTLNDNGRFTVEIASDGAATIIAQGANTRNYMQYNNKSTSSPAFYCTDGSFGAVCLYKLYE